jgi:3-phosphoshikimate 1-carboxyvinyltransferase
MIHLPDPLPIMPFTRPVRGEVSLPGSKSITNRALLLAALCDGPVTIANALFSEDTEIMTNALRQLGFEAAVDPQAATLRVAGQGGRIPAPSADLFVGNAGTAARFLTALCAAAPQGRYRLDGVPQMRTRPMKGLIDALRVLGADIRCPGVEGFFPIEIRARGLRGGRVSIDASESSQMLSALLMTAPLANSPAAIHVKSHIVSEPFVQMTWDMMQKFGMDAVALGRGREGDFLTQPAKYSLPGGSFEVEGDATAASYFAVLPIVVGGKSELRVHGLVTHDLALQGDFQFVKLLADQRLLRNVTWGGSPKPLIPGEWRKGIDADFNAFSDTFLTLAAIAPLLDGPTRITGIAHTRRQETDRVAGAACELRRLGQEVSEEEGALTITPRPPTPDVEIETYNDHRFAMSFAILGCHDLLGNGQPWLRLRNPGCCAKTFPGFFEVLGQVWTNAHSRQ